MIRVVHVLGDLSVGGVESFIMSVYRRIDRDKIQFDFLVHNLENDAYREEIEELGGRIFIPLKKRRPRNFRYRSPGN